MCISFTTWRTSSVGWSVYSSRCCSENHLTTQADTGSPVVQSRLDNLLAQGPQESSLSDAFHHFTAPTLPHLLALFIHPVASFPPKDTGVIVVDTVSSSFETSYHRDGRQGSTTEAARWVSNRKFAMMSELINKLSKMAGLRNLAVLLICQTSTKLRYGAPAVLLPAVSSNEWDNGISTQLCLFRDFPPAALQYSQRKGRKNAVRYIGVTKAGGTALAEHRDAFSSVIPFTIEKVRLSKGVSCRSSDTDHMQHGLNEVSIDPTEHLSAVLSSPARPTKRPREIIEIEDSEAEDLGSDEEFGWDDEDDIVAEGLVDNNHYSADAMRVLPVLAERG